LLSDGHVLLDHGGLQDESGWIKFDQEFVAYAATIQIVWTDLFDRRLAGRYNCVLVVSSIPSPEFDNKSISTRKTVFEKYYIDFMDGSLFRRYVISDEDDDKNLTNKTDVTLVTNDTEIQDQDDSSE
jgi:hypothetical protein